ncbi:MAG: tetratricopeptide repeat protein [Nitrospirae bacterium]|nr:tetratricopeptide repeat protein [Candidatus Manganitrophaceae bacterium]
MSDKALSPEILKLMEKISANPTSRLFVPLAEEYLKCDLAEEAAAVLVDGIKNHPTYVGARVMLGKIYLQKNQIPEAEAEFEQVITIHPENILAHKKLAQIYQKKGSPQQALESCRKALAIDPSDKEAKGLIALLEEEAAAAPLEPTPAGELKEETAHIEASEASAVAPEPTPLTPEEVQSDISPDVPVEAVAEDGMIDPALATLVEQIVSQDRPHDGSNEVQEPAALPSAFEEKVEDLAPSESAPEMGLEVKLSAAPLPEEISPVKIEEPWAEEKTVVAGFQIPPPEEILSSSPMEIGLSRESRENDEVISPTLASLYMSQGHYKEAVELYEKLLVGDPSDEESRLGLEKALQHLSPPRYEAEELPAAHSKPAKPAEPGDEKRRKTQRLQAWLETIRKKE